MTTAEYLTAEQNARMLLAKLYQQDNPEVTAPDLLNETYRNARPSKDNPEPDVADARYLTLLGDAALQMIVQRPGGSTIPVEQILGHADAVGEELRWRVQDDLGRYLEHNGPTVRNPGIRKAIMEKAELSGLDYALRFAQCAIKLALFYRVQV